MDSIVFMNEWMKFSEWSNEMFLVFNGYTGNLSIDASIFMVPHKMLFFLLKKSILCNVAPTTRTEWVGYGVGECM